MFLNCSVNEIKIIRIAVYCLRIGYISWNWAEKSLYVIIVFFFFFTTRKDYDTPSMEVSTVWHGAIVIMGDSTLSTTFGRPPMIAEFCWIVSSRNGVNRALRKWDLCNSTKEMIFPTHPPPPMHTELCVPFIFFCFLTHTLTHTRRRRKKKASDDVPFKKENWQNSSRCIHYEEQKAIEIIVSRQKTDR